MQAPATKPAASKDLEAGMDEKNKEVWLLALAGDMPHMNSISIHAEFMCFQEPKESEEPEKPAKSAKKGNGNKSAKKVCVCLRPLVVCYCLL